MFNSFSLSFPFTFPRRPVKVDLDN